MRKPKLEGWQLFTNSVWCGPGVMHSKSGRFWIGTKKLQSIGMFFLKAAKWSQEQHDKEIKKRKRMNER